MSEKRRISPTQKKLETLRTKLLDLSAKNPLLQYKHPKSSSLRIINAHQHEIFLTLLREKEITFKPIAFPSQSKLIEYGYLSSDSDTKGLTFVKPKPTSQEWIDLLKLDVSYSSCTPRTSQGVKHSSSVVHVPLFPDELEHKLKNLYRKSESIIQETGSNILYIAFGFLLWRDKDDSNVLQAPLYLMPIRLQKNSYNKSTKTYTYSIRYSGEDITPNISLMEKLRNEMNIELPLCQSATSEGDPMGPQEYLQEVKKRIKIYAQWEVKSYTTISLFNFSRLLMYNDLHFSSWPTQKSILKHPIVSSLLEGEMQDQIVLHEGELADGSHIDTNYPIVYDADQSQYRAIIDAVDGSDMVIVGPPGTGKSQTITNIIASCMNKQKSVLFIAEKLAALEVVKNRLERAGLGSFCLELHSHKTQKTKIIGDIKERLASYKTMEKPPSTL